MGNLDVKSIALVVMVTLIVTFLISLGADYLIKRTGRPTMSQLAWDDPILGIPILWPLAGAFVALVVHLYYR